MEEPFLPERFGSPTLHPSSDDRHPVDPAGAMRDIPANVVPALLPEDLALARDMSPAFEAVFIGAVTVFFLEHGSRNTLLRIRDEPPEQKLKVVIVERNVAVEVADDLPWDVLHPFDSGV